MAKKRTINEEINAFFEMWDYKQMVSFIQSIAPIMELYDIEVEDNWVKEAVGEENEKNVILIRTAYLMSKMADLHAGVLCRIKTEHKDLWYRLEKQVEIEENGRKDKEDRNGDTSSIQELEEVGSCR